MSIVKIIAAFGLGIAMLAGLQSAYLWTMQRQITSQQAGLPPIGQAVTTPKFNSGPIMAGLPKYGPIDTTDAQRAAINARGHQIYLQNRAAANAVPLPPRIPGFRR